MSTLLNQHEGVCVNECVGLTRLFSAPHLSGALLSGECVRNGWLASAAKGRLEAPYFSWEKNQTDAPQPPRPLLLLNTHSPPAKHTGLALSAQLLKGGYASLGRVTVQALDGLCLIAGWAEELRWNLRGRLAPPPAPVPYRPELFSHNCEHWRHVQYFHQNHKSACNWQHVRSWVDSGPLVCWVWGDNTDCCVGNIGAESKTGCRQEACNSGSSSVSPVRGDIHLTCV